MEKSLLLIIDAQEDFCNPSGSLYVPGAEYDMERLAQWIENNNPTDIIATLDTHNVLDISHPTFWKDSNGNEPKPFTNITYQDVISGKWIPLYEKERVSNYLKKLEEQGEYVHTIWPLHCIVGSKGWTLYKPISDALINWAVRNKKFYTIVEKGLYPYSEHFGIFAAQVQFEDAPETAVNYELINKLKEYDIIYIAGEAKSHCVATSIKQLNKYAPEVLEKVYLISNCTSNVPGFENIANDIYQEARGRGMKEIIA